MSFSDLSKNAKRVAEAVEHAQRVHITRRDGEGLFLTTEHHDRQREETADVTARLLSALLSSDEGARAVLIALPQVFPWTRHLSPEEMREFVIDLVDAARDATDLDVHANLHRVIVEWRATARLLADPDLAAQLTKPLTSSRHPKDTDT
ncbi:prevent-host-death family protein [Streptomyces sp. JJ66]|uniref:prevent-host-death family protein n=1 Tax=Streptomyces sp. JJ66 TaxID=2803843 RepID=UPI0027E34D28|nr:prevent-host-death family protein [Streptomyces sp. JJ66]